MDPRHRFHTDATFLWVRAEHVAIVVVAAVLGLLHARDVDWPHFIAAFVAIDLIGYVPGAIEYRRRRGPISAFYHHAYNLTHSYLVAGAVVAVWALLLGRFEWAMVAIPIHLSGDRGLFGNTYKPASLPFEVTA